MLLKPTLWCLSVCIIVAAIGPAGAACYQAQQQVSAPTVDGFVGNPGQLLSSYPSGGAQMISQVRDLAASNPATLTPLLGLLSSANESQQSAIGSGLGQAYRICIGSDQGFATQIQQGIAGASSGPAQDAYASVNPDVPIGTAAGAGGGGGSGLGGPTTASGNSGIGGFSTPLSSFGTPNNSVSILTGGQSGGAAGMSASTVVSPR